MHRERDERGVDGDIETGERRNGKQVVLVGKGKNSAILIHCGRVPEVKTRWGQKGDKRYGGYNDAEGCSGQREEE